MEGTVRSVLGVKNYGFIRTDRHKDYFFHREDFLGHWDDLVEDFEADKVIKVQFDIGSTPKGPRARNVKLCE